MPLTPDTATLTAIIEQKDFRFVCKIEDIFFREEGVALKTATEASPAGGNALEETISVPTGTIEDLKNIQEALKNAGIRSIIRRRQ